MHQPKKQTAWAYSLQCPVELARRLSVLHSTFLKNPGRQNVLTASKLEALACKYQLHDYVAIMNMKIFLAKYTHKYVVFCSPALVKRFSGEHIILFAKCISGFQTCSCLYPWLQRHDISNEIFGIFRNIYVNAWRQKVFWKWKNDSKLQEKSVHALQKSVQSDQAARRVYSC